MKYSPVFGRYCFLTDEEEDGEGDRVVRVGDEVVVRRANAERTKFGKCYASSARFVLGGFLLMLELQIGKVLPQALRRLGKEDETLRKLIFVNRMPENQRDHQVWL